MLFSTSLRENLPCPMSRNPRLRHFHPSLGVLLPRAILTPTRSPSRFLSPGEPGFFLFFGSTTVPLAARESPLTRRMDDLRISSRSLSLVRSRYRRRSSPRVLLSTLSFSPSQFSLVFFFPRPPVFHEPTRPHRLLLLLIARLGVVVFCIRMPCALTNESSARAFGVPAK